MKDLINRNASVDAIKSGYIDDTSSVECPEECNAMLDWAIETIEGMPSEELDTDRIYAELSKVYNIKGLPDEAIDIIGDLMLSLDLPSAQPEPMRLRLDHKLSKEEYERLKKECLEQSPIILLPKESAQPDNQVHLCNSCKYTYPECPSKKDDVIFGNGVGNDNICMCNKYLPSAQPEHQCCECKHYEGVHGAMGHAPCNYWKIGGVMWNDFCSRFKER